MDLNTDDINLLAKLKRLSKLIIENESILSDLEVNQLKDRQIYQELFNNLQTLIHEENSLYNSITNNHQQIAKLIKHLDNNDNFFNLPTQLETLINNNQEIIISRRIAIKLKEIDLNINCNELENEGNLLFINTPKNKMSINSKFGILIIDQEIRKDIIYTILKLIEEEINHNPIQEYKAYFIKMKYRLASMYKFVEKKLINSNFNYQEQLYWLSQNYAYYHKIDNTLYEAYKSEIIATLGTFTTSYFNDLEDSDLEKPKTIIEAQFYKILLSTTLMFSPPVIKENLSRIAKKILADKQAHQMNYEGEKMIIETIESIQNNQIHPQLITIRIRKKES